MTQDEIISMAEESGMTQYVAAHNKYLQRFATLVAQREREACAEICDSHAQHFNRNELRWEWSDEAAACADEIRARDTKKGE